MKSIRSICLLKEKFHAFHAQDMCETFMSLHGPTLRHVWDIYETFWDIQEGWLLHLTLHLYMVVDDLDKKPLGHIKMVLLEFCWILCVCDSVISRSSVRMPHAPSVDYRAAQERARCARTSGQSLRVCAVSCNRSSRKQPYDIWH